MLFCPDRLKSRDLRHGSGSKKGRLRHGPGQKTRVVFTTAHTCTGHICVTVACRVPRRGGLTGHSIILYMSTGARALTIALCPVKVCTNGGKLEYIYIEWWAATWSIYC